MSMDARLLKVSLILSIFISMGATYRTPNFVVQAPSEQIAKQVAETAERCRVELAIEWLEEELPKWDKPCKVTVKVGQIGAGGATSFAFDRGEVFGWSMRVQGSLERILDSVIPHEVSHTIFACYFRRPLPRWADEGAATLVEHESERKRQTLMLKQVFNTRRRIPLKNLLAIKEYPKDMQDVLTLYAQGYSLADFLVQRGGKKRYLQFLNDAHKHGWDHSIRKHYRLNGTKSLEKKWSGWVVAGSPQLQLPKGQLLAQANEGSNSTRQANVVFRSQSPEERSKSNGSKSIDRATSNDKRPRGKGLLAPELHASAEQTKPAERDNARKQGRDRTAKEGWVHPGKSRLPRPTPLTLRQTFHSDNSTASTQKSSIDSRNLRLPRTDPLETEPPEAERKHHPVEEQKLEPSRFPDWSQYPRRRAQ